MEFGSREERALAAACAVAVEAGLECGQAAVLNAGSNVMVDLRPSPVIARVMTGTVVLHEDPAAWLGREVSVLGFLAPARVAVAPSPLVAPGPYRREGLWMTFWEALEHRGSADLAAGPEQLGRALRELHHELAGYAGELPGFVDVQERIERLLGLLRPTADLSAERIESLQARLRELGLAVFGTALPAQALHGDASLSNLLVDASGPLVWNDFEDVVRGPVHWDLAGFLISLEHQGADPDFVAATLGAYGGIEAAELAPFTAAHAVYDEVWALYDAQRRLSP